MSTAPKGKATKLRRPVERLHLQETGIKISKMIFTTENLGLPHGTADVGAEQRPRRMTASRAEEAGKSEEC